MFSSYQTGCPDKQTLIFLHGFMGDHKDWDLIISKLKEHFHCVTLDLPGHGQSPNIEKKEKFFTFLKYLINSFPNAYLIGYSMGGRILLDFLHHSPDAISQIKGIVIESSHPGISQSAKKAERYKNDLKLLANIKSENELQVFLKKWYQSPLFGDISKHHSFNQLISKKRLKRRKPLLSASDIKIRNQLRCKVVLKCLIKWRNWTPLNTMLKA